MKQLVKWKHWASSEKITSNWENSSKRKGCRFLKKNKAKKNKHKPVSQFIPKCCASFVTIWLVFWFILVCLGQTASKMSSKCKTCKCKITQNEKSDDCSGCNCILLLELSFICLSNVDINGFNELGFSFLLLSKTCIENIERDNFSQNRTKYRVNEHIEALKIEDKLQSRELKLTSWLTKVEEVLRFYCKEIRNNYCEITAKNVEPASKPRLMPEPDQKQMLIHNISTSLRIFGIREDLHKKKQ